VGEPERVALLGTGLIGGSIGKALRARGVAVQGYDSDHDRARRAVEVGAVDVACEQMADAVAGADVVVVAAPVGTVADVVIAALDAGAVLVTDVGSVKAPVLAAVETARPALASRYVGGHPMAGSEQEGVDGADAGLFVGATWVLTPTTHTDPAAFAAVRALVAGLGAEVLAVPAEVHDSLVAVVSHVPQLAASTLMNLASSKGDEHAVLLRLAAGGFRDMTRIASGHPAIWPDICVANRDAIVGALDGYLAALEHVRALVAVGDRSDLLALLERARAARRALPVGLPDDELLVELRIPVPDRPGVIAQVTTLATELGVNIADLEIAHSIEGRRGVLVLVVTGAALDQFEAALASLGYHTARRTLG
jgi:prephenate dehydrogenase